MTDSRGQLGRGARESQNEPVAVDVNLKFTTIAAGGKHACAIAVGGRIYCWGANVAGEIGDGSKTERDRPVVVPGRAPYTALTAGTRTYLCTDRRRRGVLLGTEQGRAIG